MYAYDKVFKANASSSVAKKVIVCLSVLIKALGLSPQQPSLSTGKRSYTIASNGRVSIPLMERRKPNLALFRYCKTCARGMYHDKGHHTAWSERKAAREKKDNGSTNGTTTDDTTDSTSNNGSTLVGIGKEIDQDFIFGHEDDF